MHAQLTLFYMLNSYGSMAHGVVSLANDVCLLVCCVQVFDLYVRALAKLGIVLESVHSGASSSASGSGSESWTVSKHSTVVHPLSLMMSSLLLPELTQVQWVAADGGLHPQHLAAAAATQHLSRLADPASAAAAPAGAPAAAPAAGVQTRRVSPRLQAQDAAASQACASGTAPPPGFAPGAPLEEALKTLAQHALSHAQSVETALMSLYSVATRLIKRSLIPQCGPWGTLAGSDLWCGQEYRSMVWRVLRSSADKARTDAGAAGPSGAGATEANKEDSADKAPLRLHRPLPNGLLASVSWH